jgi:hypothetical protein
MASLIVLHNDKIVSLYQRDDPGCQSWRIDYGLVQNFCFQDYGYFYNVHGDSVNRGYGNCSTSVYSETQELTFDKCVPDGSSETFSIYRLYSPTSNDTKIIKGSAFPKSLHSHKVPNKV